MKAILERLIKTLKQLGENFAQKKYRMNFWGVHFCKTQAINQNAKLSQVNISRILRNY